MTNYIFRRLNCKRFDVGANLVGIDSRMKKIILRLQLSDVPSMELSDVRIIGIYGVGGIGKTTIAKVVYNKLSCEFEYMSFLENIREVSNTRGLSHLQNQLLSDILEGEGIQIINSVEHEASMIKSIPSSKRAFIVLDDVDDFDQLEYILRNREWLGKGSRVIITTRNKHLLTLQEVDDLYEVEELHFEEAYLLFSLYAFKQNLPKSDFINLSNRVVYYCQGLPLALKVLGSLLFNKTIPQWESELHKLDREPEAKILNVLKRSYDGLDRTEKNIFLDVACFFKGEDKYFVSRILDGCNFYAERGIKNLTDKCLITIPYNQIQMHDLIQQMGWEIVREKFPHDPDKWSRLWDPHDIERALITYEGIKQVETLSLDLSKLKRVRFNSNVFAKMTRLRLLKVHSGVHLDLDDANIEEEVYDVVIKNVSKMRLGLDFEFPSYELRYLYWDGYPSDFLPPNFDGENLVDLHLKYSNIKQLWQGNKYLESLKVIDLSYSNKLIHMPELSSMSNLERLILQGCVSLIDIHPSVGNMKKLTTLNLKRCDMLKDLPDSIGKLESLEILDLSDCSKFEKFPKKGGNMKSLKQLRLSNTAIKDLPNSIGYLESLEILAVSYCSNFEKFPEIEKNMKHLRYIDLRRTAIEELPSSIDNLSGLQRLDLGECKKLRSLPNNISKLKFLKTLILRGCSNLRKLNINHCKMAQQILELPSSLEEIDAHDCTSKEDLSSLLWLCHLNWKSATKELKCWKLSVLIPEGSGIPEWIRHQKLGSEVTTKLPMNWYEDPDFLGFVVSCVYPHIPTPDAQESYLFGSSLICELNLHGNGFGFKDECRFPYRCECHVNFNDVLLDQVWVLWYPKIAIPKEHRHNTHFSASCKDHPFPFAFENNIQRCGVSLIFAGDHLWNSGDNGSTSQDTNGNVRGADQDDGHYHIPFPTLLDLLRYLETMDQ